MRYRNLLPAAVAALVIAGCGDVPPPDVPFLGHGDGYEYPHDHASGTVDQQYLPDGLVGRRWYEPSAHGDEADHRPRGAP